MSARPATATLERALGHALDGDRRVHAVRCGGAFGTRWLVA